MRCSIWKSEKVQGRAFGDASDNNYMRKGVVAHICSSPFLDAQSVTGPSKIERSWEFEVSGLFRKADKNEHI